ncbi:MAG: hypothetical protein Q9213_007636 [Squamulea squamosa]
MSVLPTGHPPLEETESLPIPSTGVAAVTGPTNSGDTVGTTSGGVPDFSSQPDLSSGQDDASGYTISGTGSGAGQIGQPTFSGGPSATPPSNSGGFPDSTNPGPSAAASASGANSSNVFLSSVSEVPQGLCVCGASGISGLFEDLTTTSERGGGDTDLFGRYTWTSTPIRTIGAVSSVNTGAPTVSGAPSSQQVGDQSSQGKVSHSNPNTGNIETSSSQNLGDPGNTASGGSPEPQPTRPNSGPIKPPPAIPTMSLDRESPEASSEAITIGGLLSRLSNSAKSYSTDITIPTTKTALLENIDDTEHELETLFKNLGGSLPPDTGGCSSGGGGGLGGLVGDIFNTVRCVINSINTLKEHVDIPEPDFPTIEGI